MLLAAGNGLFLQIGTIDVMPYIIMSIMVELRKSMQLAEAIKNVLRKRNISKSEFAVMMEQDIDVIRKWLSGTYTFNLETLMDICLKLELI